MKMLPFLRYLWKKGIIYTFLAGLNADQMMLESQFLEKKTFCH